MIMDSIFMEDLISRYPESVGYLVAQKVVCLVCGEPIWGTLREAAEKSGKTGDEIEAIVRELNVRFTRKTP
jgi:hypothetical protein